MKLEKINKTIYESEAIIKSNENIIGGGLWNIGNELKTIRDTKSYKEKGYNSFEKFAENELNYKKSHCYNFISIVESYNFQSIGRLPEIGMTKLLSLVQIPEEERKQFIEDNPVEDMTTRELRQAIKEKKELEQKIKELEEQEPKIVEKEVPPSDYDYYKNATKKLQDTIFKLNREIQDNDLKLENLEHQKSILERKAKLNEKEAKEFNKLRSQIENLSKQKDDLGRQIKARTELSGLVVRIEHMLKTELAPIKYSRAIKEAKEDEIVINNLTEIIDRVQDWCIEMQDELGDQNIINVEVIRNE